MKNILALLFWFMASFSAGWFGSQFKPGEWYQSLQKPSWTSPALAFPIAWTILYSLMSVAAWLVWKKRSEDSFISTTLVFFLIQLVLNAAWSWIFFGRHQIGWALLEMGALWLMIALTVYSFLKINPLAGFLMIPYLLWVGFALILNWAIWRRN
ncbi:MAG: Tryptophan-rich protein TspO [Elusimicrobia bacterium]|nr:Tryptophan-rich protein TspO [Elusimicrobiota bacterium]